MGRTMKRLALAGAAMLAMTGAALAAAAVPPNKQLVIDFFNFAGTRAERAETMLTPDYVQHNPRFLVWGERLGVRGSDAWVKVFPDAAAKGVRLVELGGIPLRRPINVMVEGDLVHAVYRGRIADQIIEVMDKFGDCFRKFALVHEKLAVVRAETLAHQTRVRHLVVLLAETNGECFNGPVREPAHQTDYRARIQAA